jgi:hypothetical protein
VAGLRVTPGVSSVSVSLSVRLLGPVTLTLPNTRQANKDARIAEMLELYFLEGLSWAEIGKKVTRNPELAYSQVRKHLAETYPQLSSGSPTRSCSAPSLPVASLWHGLTGAGSVTDLRRAWVVHVQGVYLAGVPYRKTWATDTHRLRRAVLAYVLAHQSDPEEGVLLHLSPVRGRPRRPHR